MEAQGNDQSGGLSVNAAVFIPRGCAPPIGGGPIQNLPSYMTNCFPFVQPDFNGNRFGGNHGNWSRNPRPNRFGNRNNPGYHNNRFPAPNKFSDSPLFSFTSPPPPSDAYFNQFVPPPNNFLMNNFSSLPVMPSDNKGRSKNQTESDKDINSNSFTTNNRWRRNQKNRNNNNNIQQKVNVNSEDIGRKGDNQNRQRRRSNSGRHGGSKKDSAREPVLVLYEKENQTDFSEMFAYKPLMEHPSPLYRKPSGKRHRQLDPDSDSGYSSPLHKMNQITIGIQSESRPVVPLVNTPSSIQSDDPSIVSAAIVPQQKLSYAFIAQKEPSPQSVITAENQKSAFQENFKTRRQKSNDGNATNDNTKNGGKFSKNRSHDPNDSNSSNRNNSTYNQHFNTKSSGNTRESNQENSQSKGKKFGHKSFNEGSDNLKGDNSNSIKGGNPNKPLKYEEENDYGFSRTKNRRQSQETKPENNSVKGGTQNNEGFESKQIEKEDNSGLMENTTTGKKRRRRRRKKKKNLDDGGDSHDEETINTHEVELHFEDVEEFPDLGSATASGAVTHGPGILYSAVLQSAPVRPSYMDKNKTSSSEDSPRKGNSVEEPKGTKASRKRRKRKDLLNTAAENELAEIGLEQQMLKEQCLKTQGQKKEKSEKGQTPGILKVNPKGQGSGKKSKQNVSLDLGAVIDALEKKTTISLTTAPRKDQKVSTEQPKKRDPQKSKSSHNVLDASAPIKRGKERETPKPKKPSPLKKVILKEREEKKHLKMLEGPESASTEAPVGIGVVSAESDLSQDALSTKSSIDYTGTPGSANLSPVSQTSPISMSPLSPGTSPLSSEVNSPIAGAVGKDVIRKIHSRRFREYCNQVLDKEIDESTTALLQDLVRFQDRMYHKDPNKAKLKRRLVLGLREVTKHLKLKKIKCVIISPNLEKIQSKGGLDDALNNILTLCNDQDVPFVFALGRRALGRACAKLVPVSVVGIFNYNGSEDNFRQLMDLTAKARESYGEMVLAIEKEIKEYPMKMQQQPTTPHVFAHMGHSRTPSGASVLSFTSSILSEPISENYPHSEPETDSKGYEIVKDETLLKQGLPTDQTGYQTQMRIIHSNTRGHDDDGNEADNEDEDKVKKSNFWAGEENSNQSDSVSALPHIDSIHSSTHDLNTEILSQHSGRTIENCEAMSTHSSRTLGDGSSTILADMGDRSKHGTPKSTESPSNTLQRGKVIDEERIQHWVDETSSRLENLALEEESYEESTDEMTDSDESDNFEMHNDSNSRHDAKNSTICDTKTDMSKVSEKLQNIAKNSEIVNKCDSLGNNQASDQPSIPSACNSESLRSFDCDRNNEVVVKHIEDSADQATTENVEIQN